jgi:thiamine-phosphate diphosphorylase
MALPTRIGRLRLPVLCFVIGKADVKDGDIEKLEELVKAAVAGGVSMIQLRDHETPAGELLTLARKLKSAARGRALFMVNDRVDVAMLVEADGVQLPENGLPTRAARGLIGRYTVLGRSVHDVDTAQQANREGAEFVIAGTIYKSTSKPAIKPVGLGLISEITKDASIPVLAIGGIDAGKVSDVIKAGAAGVAVISAIAAAEDPKAAAQELTDALREAWAERAATAAAAAASA